MFVVCVCVCFCIVLRNKVYIKRSKVTQCQTA